jgi:hypothetical protein
MSPYRYEALKDPHHQFRLVELCPAPNKADALIATISHHSLDDHPPFWALSYTWSYHQISTPFRLHDADLCIGLNLAAALRFIRHDQKPQLLWIDAVCVNQEDEDERSEQVQLMPWIFSASAKVIAWLGEATSDSKNALGLLENLKEEHIAEMAESDFQCSNWKALKKLWSRPFWKRIWIVQELALGGDRVTVQCGDASISRTALERAYKILQLHLNNPLTLLWEGLECEMDWFMNQLAVCCEFDRANRTLNENLHLENLLEFTGHFRATDERDHIYALLGISKDAAHAGIKPDYSKTLEQVWAHTVKQLVENKQSIKVLKGNKSPRDDDESPNLSSWMPAFGDRVRRGYGWRQGFQVLSRDKAARAAVSKCGRLLKIKGFFIDHVDVVEGPFENSKSEFLNGSIFSRMEEMCNQALNKLRDKDLFVTSETPFLAFLNILTSNLASDTRTDYGGDHDTVILQGQLERLLRPANSNQCDQQRTKDLAALLRGIVITLRYRCFFTTKMGLVGVGPYDTKKGDLCVALLGGDVPFVLRKETDKQILVGDCYVHGIMNGELAHLPNDKKTLIREQLFVIH